MFATCLSTTFGEMNSSPAIAVLDLPCASRASTSPLALGELRERIAAPSGVQQAGDDLGVEHGAT